MVAKIHVTFKEGVLDPQGKAVHHALTNLGYKEVASVNMGKYMEIQLDSVSRDEAQHRIEEMCEKFLTNPIIESYRFTLDASEWASPFLSSFYLNRGT